MIIKDEDVGFIEENLHQMDSKKLKALRDLVDNEQKKFYNMEQAVKVTLNSMYGAFANEWFFFYNINLAETITLQSKDSILYAEKRLNHYFKEEWHTDYAVHEMMGIKVTGRLAKPVVIYIDTDSCYVSFEEVIDKSTWDAGDEKDFILKLQSTKLKVFLEDIFLEYAEDFNTENHLVFEMESIAARAIWLAKKKYLQDLVWADPDVHYERLSKIKVRGFETIQSSTSEFVRKKLNEIIRYVFSNEDIDMHSFVRLLKTIKKEFKLSNIEKISKNLRINDYDKYIISDKDVFEINKGCPLHVRGAGYHNYLLNNSTYKDRYNLIFKGEKVKTYYTKDPFCDVFSFIAGEYPYEFAPEYDYDIMFEKTIIDPVNRILKVIGLQELDRNLIYSAAVF